MKEFTQTSLAPRGNCWQTAVACILEVEPSKLPDQATNDSVLVDGSWQGKSYNNAIQAYLRTHHDMAYLELHGNDELMECVQIRDDRYHLMTGETIRSEENAGMRHVVVGRRGVVVWDPHPSRAGLTDGIRWAFLTAFPKEWDRADSERLNPCVCPACQPVPASLES